MAGVCANCGEVLYCDGCKEPKGSESDIDKLRGQLQNCVDHLHWAKRHIYTSKFDKVIESANKTLYETLMRDK